MKLDFYRKRAKSEQNKLEHMVCVSIITKDTLMFLLFLVRKHNFGPISEWKTYEYSSVLKAGLDASRFWV